MLRIFFQPNEKNQNVLDLFPFYFSSFTSFIFMTLRSEDSMINRVIDLNCSMVLARRSTFMFIGGLRGQCVISQVRLYYCHVDFQL
jgi:hypothetical protein